jgi:hypothetical protein
MWISNALILFDFLVTSSLSSMLTISCWFTCRLLSLNILAVGTVPLENDSDHICVYIILNLSHSILIQHVLKYFSIMIQLCAMQA